MNELMLILSELAADDSARAVAQVCAACALALAATYAPALLRRISN